MNKDYKLIKEDKIDDKQKAHQNEFTDKEIENILKTIDGPFEEISFEELCKL